MTGRNQKKLNPRSFYSNGLHVGFGVCQGSCRMNEK
jgi:hypothetical protein